MGKIIIVGILLLMLASGFTLVSIDRADDGVKIMSDDDYKEIDGDNLMEEYQGPVPQGYNLEHFRATGETVLEGDIINNG